jgi:nudix-type nucleoside diphosphatase (YffH/AdpP family)
MEMDGNRVEIIEERTLYKGWSYLREFIINYTRTDGIVEKQTREIYNSGDGAAVLMYNATERKVLLIRQFRLPVLLNNHVDGFILECPAGMLDELDPQKAITKEIMEETGYQTSQVQKVYEAFATPGAHMEKIHFYIASYDQSMKTSLGGGQKSEQEDIEVIEYDFSEIQDLLKTGKIIDAKTIILLQWALLNLVK